jgi:hypothetical protein
VKTLYYLEPLYCRFPNKIKAYYYRGLPDAVVKESFRSGNYRAVLIRSHLQCLAFLIRGLLGMMRSRDNALVIGLGFSETFWFRIRFIFPRLVKGAVAYYFFKPQRNWKKKLLFANSSCVTYSFTPIPLPSCQEDKVVTLPYGYPDWLIDKSRTSERYDVSLTGARHDSRHYAAGAYRSPDLRGRINDYLLSIAGDARIFCNVSDDKIFPILSYERYLEVLLSSRVCIATLSAHNDVNPRYFEIIGSRSILLCERPIGIYEKLLSGVPGILFFNSTIEDFISQLDTALTQVKPDPTKFYQLAIDHSWTARAKTIVHYLFDR